MKAQKLAATSADEAKTVPLNAPQPNKRAEAKAALQAQMDALKRQEDELDQEAQREHDRQRAQMQYEHDELLRNARDYRQEAKNTTDAEEKKVFYDLAIQCEKGAQTFARELGINSPTLVEVNQPWFIRYPRVTAVVQVLGIALLIAWMHGTFNMLREHIDELNVKLPLEKQMQPYDTTSIQKLFYEKLVVFSDLPIALLLLFLMVPFVAFYVLPVFRSEKDFYREFFNDLTPWQRSIITTIFSLGVLLFLALSHLVKP